MCGIAGSINLSPQVVSPDVVNKMTALESHRGPDGDGFFVSGDRRVHLGHRRLKIIDLSENARQPMANQEGTVWLTYNGEIYNYRELDEILKAKGYVYRSQSDSETIVHAYEEWGESCVERFNGMFAFAIWDERKKLLFCARDRFSEKPFYYYKDASRFLFASEIKALFVDSTVPREPNYKTLARYLQYNETDTSEDTFFRHIHSLPAAHTLTWKDGGLSVRRYWNLPDAKPAVEKSEQEWTQEFLALLNDSVRLRLRSDVPVGTCLSGGLDSSSIICLMTQMVDKPISAFSVVYDEEGFSERPFMQAMADALPLRSYRVTPNGEDLFDTLKRIVWHNDEPSSSTGQYSQWHVMKLAAEKGVTVILNGQGGDELMGGYWRYLPTYTRELMMQGRWRQAALEINGDVRLHNGSLPQNFKQVLYPMMPGALQKAYARTLSTQERADKFLSQDFLTSHTPNGNGEARLMKTLREHLAVDLTVKSVPYLVHHEDRCSMAFSREIRLPFLDHRLVELSFQMPSDLKIRNGVTKYILRKAMAGQGMPETVLNRQDKKGYATPVGKWFRTVAREEVREILSSLSFAQRGIFDTQNTTDSFSRHCAGSGDFTRQIWQWVNVELWFREFFA